MCKDIEEAREEPPARHPRSSRKVKIKGKSESVLRFAFSAPTDPPAKGYPIAVGIPLLLHRQPGGRPAEVWSAMPDGTVSKI